MKFDELAYEESRLKDLKSKRAKIDKAIKDAEKKIKKANKN